jgi:hypothetical protein
MMPVRPAAKLLSFGQDLVNALQDGDDPVKNGRERRGAKRRKRMKSLDSGSSHDDLRMV